MKPVYFEGERLTREQIEASRKVIRDLAIECAGQFFEEDRSEKFRQIWGSSDESQRIFAETQWSNFLMHARAFCAEQLNRENTPEHEKERYHRALVVEATLGTRRGAQAVPLQLAPNTAQFEGERADNQYIAEHFGNRAATVPERLARFKASAAYHMSKLLH